MNRPKKSKAHDPLMPEDAQVDERNIIDLEDAAELSFEDRASIYWMENKGFVIGCVIALILVIIGYNGARIYKDFSEEKLQTAFADADAAGELEAFALVYPGKELGGFAALNTADSAYKEADYAKALQFYEIAADALSKTILAGRAQLGVAFSIYHSGQTDEGIAKLSAIAANTALAGSTRAEAAYHLAIESDLNGDETAFQAYSAQINESAIAGPWQQRLSMHQGQVR